MGLGDTLKRALKATTTGVAKQTVRDTFSGIREGKPLKLLYRPIGAPSTGLISAIEIETQRRKEQTRFAEEAEQTEKQVALEAKLTEEEKMSRRKAAEEQLARRRATPGRPVFTSLINRGTLLQ